MNMEDDTWLCIEDDDVSSHHSFSDSDNIDSETEAELYSKIHYESSLPSLNCQDSESANAQPSELLVFPSCSVNNLFLSKRKEEDIQSYSQSMTENLWENVDLEVAEALLNKSAVCDTLDQKSCSEKCKSDSYRRPPSVILCSEKNADYLKVNTDLTNNSTICNKLDLNNAAKTCKPDSSGRPPSVILCSEENANYLEAKDEMPNKSVIYSKLSQKNATKKHKSDSYKRSSSVILCCSDSEEMDVIESSKHSLLNGSKNKKARYSSPRNHSPQEKNNSKVDSSDSDSFIWTELDTSEKSDFKINLSNDDGDTIYLSSESDDELSILSSVKRDSVLKNLSMPNIKMGEHSKDLWHINNEDLYRQKKYSRRYHENIDITCSNCNSKGHTHRTCPAPKAIKCFICGGEHVGAKCANRVCTNCYAFGHDHKRCWKRRNTFFCPVCNMKGHVKENCPDLWRRYHLTTNPVKIERGKKIKQDTNLYCWNCGEGGHFGSMCQAPYISRSRFTTWPCVISYNDPGDLLRKRLNRSKEQHANFRKNEHFRQKKNFSVTVNSSGEKDVRLKQKNDLTEAEQSMQKRMGGNKKKRRMDTRFERVLKIVKDKDFPRTPKKKNLQNSEDATPESMELIINKQLKKRRKNMKRRMKQKLRKLQEQNFQTNDAN